MIDHKEPETGIFQLGGMITNDARCTQEVKCRIDMAKAAFSKKNTLFTSKLDLKVRKKVVKCYVWIIVGMVLKLGHFR
jgi:hypothetical protein